MNPLNSTQASSFPVKHVTPWYAPTVLGVGQVVPMFVEKNGDPAARTGNVNNRAIRGSVTFQRPPQVGIQFGTHGSAFGFEHRSTSSTSFFAPELVELTLR